VVLMRLIMVVMMALYRVCGALRRSAVGDIRMMVSRPKEESPYVAAKALPLPRMPSVILVNTFSEANLGSVSRIMLNYGMHDLRLVAPVANPKGDEARRLAVGSVDLLDNCKIFSNLKDAIDDLQVVYATTARDRTANYETYSPRSAARKLILENIAREQPLAGIVFGPETSGLTNSDVSLCNGVINIDTFNGYPVLNLAQATNCIGYEMWQRRLEVLERAVDADPTAGGAIPAEELPSQAEVDFFLSRLEKELYSRGFRSVSKNNNVPTLLEEEERRQQFSGLLTFFKRATLSKSELRMLNGMLSALIRK